MCVVCVSVLFSTPPLVFIAGSHGVKLAEPPSATSEEMTRGKVEAVGPTGQFGRPSRSVDLPGPPTAAIFFQRAVLGLLLSEHWDTTCLEWIWVGSWATLGPIEPELTLLYFCDFMWGQSVLATCILAQKHNLHFLEGEVWFRDFIG